jgi:hypothetical protein
MILPYGIDEQYSFFIEFLNEPYPATMRILEPYYETDAILTIALQDWEKTLGPQNVHIQYIESDTQSKRKITNKLTNITKQINIELPYKSGWIWNSFSRTSNCVRPSFIQ